MAVQENIEEGKGSMTDQEYEKELAELMNSAPSDEKKHKKGRIRRAFKAIGFWSRRRKLITGAAAAAVALLVCFKISGSGGQTGVPVMTQALTRGTVEEILSVSGPVSGTDSAEVVSRLHAEILEILVKEGDRVKAGQVLARLDPDDVQKEVESLRMPMIWHQPIWMRLRERRKRAMQRHCRSSRLHKGIMTERQCCLQGEIFLRQRWRQLRIP